MNNWIEINQEEMKIGMNIAGLKKGELQIKYAKDIYNLQQKVEQLEKRNKEIYDGFKATTDELCEAEKKVEQLEKENKILKENAEHNDKVVDKVNWENMLLKGTNEKLENIIEESLSPDRYCLVHNYMVSLQQKVEQLENENFNIRENIHLERISLPPELTKDKNFMELYDIPSYEDLKNKVEQLEKENKRLKEWKEDLLSENVELENIRKEAIEIINQYMPNYASCVKAFDELENILNKGSDTK